MAKKQENSLMQQHAEMKKKHPDAILLFRVGDFYETFGQDAVDASQILGITLTKRGNGYAADTQLAGFPHHALDTYLPKLVRAGRRVAICEQLEDPRLTKKLVKRGITELVTPGLNLTDSAIPPKENNFLAALHFGGTDRRGQRNIGIAFLDLTTGEFLCAQGNADFAARLMANVRPKETLRMRGTRQLTEEIINTKTVFNELEDWIYTPQAARERLQRQFGTDSLKGFGIDSMQEALIAAGSIMHYLDYTAHTQTSHITTISRIDEGKNLYLDRFTERNLEIIRPLADDGMSLLDVLDKTVTPIGARMLRAWLSMPLTDITLINERHDCVESFFKDPALRQSLTLQLQQVGDLGRLAGKIATRRINPRQLLQLAQALQASTRIAAILKQSQSPQLQAAGAELRTTHDAAQKIMRTIATDAPAMLKKGNVIAGGFNAELDRLRHIAQHGRQALRDIENREIQNTGIPSLKIGFNNVFGYFIEVRNTHTGKVPQSWIRRQTLANAERYITPELKEYEETITGAQEKTDLLEATLYENLLKDLEPLIADFNLNAMHLARIDCLLSMAAAAEENRYVRPGIDDTKNLSITNGRHPVIEKRLPPGETYVPNTVCLNPDKQQIIMITGPNMSGKSALLRQTALITLMAQTGSFVPAEAAQIGVVDKIMSRVGASDNISAGESTFMVEMNEAAAILNNMTDRSLILFDELGRGTSTYDGISIAWAIVEHIHENGRCRPKTLFATHYHELNEMAATFGRIANFNVAVKEIDGKVIFMRRLQPGGSEHSFGIHVAKLAGMPPSIVKRATQILASLEAASGTPAGAKPDMQALATHREGYQMSIFQLDDPLLSQVRDALINLNIDNLTPLQALTKLHDLQSLLKGY